MGVPLPAPPHCRDLVQGLLGEGGKQWGGGDHNRSDRRGIGEPAEVELRKGRGGLVDVEEEAAVLLPLSLSSL